MDDRYYNMGFRYDNHPSDCQQKKFKKTINYSYEDTWTKEQFLQVMSDVTKVAHGINVVNYEEWITEELKNEFLTLSQKVINQKIFIRYIRSLFLESKHQSIRFR